MKKEVVVIILGLVMVIIIGIAIVCNNQKVSKSNQAVTNYINVEDGSQDVEEEFYGYTIAETADGTYMVFDYDVTESVTYTGETYLLDVIPELYEICEAMSEQGFIGEVSIYPISTAHIEGAGYNGSDLVCNYMGDAEYFMQFNSEESSILYDVIMDSEEGVLIEEWDESIYW